MYCRDLHNNDFDHLPIPKGGWPELRYLYLYMIFLHCIMLLNQNIVPNCKELFLYIPTIVVHLKLLHHRTGINLQVLMCPLYITELPSRIDDIENEVTISPDTKDTNASFICDFHKQFKVLST